MQFWPTDDEHMCSKHVDAWNKLNVKQKFCASSWLITEINPLDVLQLSGINTCNRIRDDRGLLTRIKCNINKQGRKKNKYERNIVKQNRQFYVLRKCKDNKILNKNFDLIKHPQSVRFTQTKKFIFVNNYKTFFIWTN